MVTILTFMQDKSGKVEEFLEKDVWGAIKEFLNLSLIHI